MSRPLRVTSSSAVVTEHFVKKASHLFPFAGGSWPFRVELIASSVLPGWDVQTLKRRDIQTDDAVRVMLNGLAFIKLLNCTKSYRKLFQ